MPSEQAIAYDFDKLLAQYPALFKGLVAYVEDIKQYGTLKQAINDTGLALEKLRKEMAEAEASSAAQVTALAAQYAAKNADLDNAFKARTEEIANMMLAARLDAENIKASGERAKEAIVSEARAVADTAGKRAQEARLAAEQAEATIAEKQAEIGKLDAAIASKQGEFARIAKNIADLKAKLG